jgi:bifunctional UDP-N-acetylglucosamine pyrophosphorylase/glucosamine-1-phosphate N-acetyltransferase
MKRTTLHERAKAPHLSYLGDATIGEGTNVGAGTITCNYDGFAKHETKIGKGVFIGTDTALVAPVRVGDGAYIAAGSVVTDNVPADALAVARGRQVNKPGWARARRAEFAATAKKATKSRRRPRAQRARHRSKPRSRH